ncbi:MAG: DNA translocase FtsK 4TM domain-containing protein, partial [Bartonella sp.]|nr:DNA translocase FtsK 4TM domain-containing protein [Bartonella sp.]
MHQTSSPYNSLKARNSQGSRLIEMFLRQIGVFIGLGLFLFIVFGVFSLATWNVADPSLTHASKSEITNFMGWPGAIFS